MRLLIRLLWIIWVILFPISVVNIYILIATPFECQLTYIGIEVLLDKIAGLIVHLLQNHFTAVNDVKTL